MLVIFLLKINQTIISIMVTLNTESSLRHQYYILELLKNVGSIEVTPIDS